MLTKTPAPYQLENHAPVATGLLIGAGGLNEWTVVGLVTWLILYLRKTWQQSWPKLYWQDSVIIAINILWICYSSYDDPFLSSDDTRLTASEGVKIILWLPFGLCMTRCSKDRFFGTINGIGIGIGLFALATLIGSLVTQPFQGSGGAIYNVATGANDAGSTYVTYACIASTLLLLLTSNKLAWVSSIICMILGIQAVNRQSLIAGGIALTFLILVFISENWEKSSIAAKNICYITAITVLAFTIIVTAVIHAGVIPIHALERFSDFYGRDNRYNVYITGYYLLSKAIILNNFNTLEYSVLNVHEQWWHSIPLDSARTSGWIGLIASVVWLCGIIKGVAKASAKSTRYILVGFLALLTLLTSIPMGTGGYELLGSLTLTQAIICSDKA